jgi:hypothetical protein
MTPQEARTKGQYRYYYPCFAGYTPGCDGADAPSTLANLYIGTFACADGVDA